MKKDTQKYIVEKMIRAQKDNEKLNSIPEQAYYETKSDYFIFLERRNENINDVINELNKECGYHLKEVRIHQKNVHNTVTQIANCIIELQHKADLVKKTI